MISGGPLQRNAAPLYTVDLGAEMTRETWSACSDQRQGEKGREGGGRSPFVAPPPCGPSLWRFKSARFSSITGGGYHGNAEAPADADLSPGLRPTEP
ncbi:hypothetical protein COCON_G00200870 [Conger conger]|uniref:Uncharacterized protein n=1 Tax=Conger conger TaxID=82655 RepID=A0A9Q1D2W2_CONCO|nr:hypothetical protein COCON_G00200870 [Conger conger]